MPTSNIGMFQCPKEDGSANAHLCMMVNPNLSCQVIDAPGDSLAAVAGSVSRRKQRPAEKKLRWGGCRVAARAVSSRHFRPTVHFTREFRTGTLFDLAQFSFDTRMKITLLWCVGSRRTARGHRRRPLAAVFRKAAMAGAVDIVRVVAGASVNAADLIRWHYVHIVRVRRVSSRSRKAWPFAACVEAPAGSGAGASGRTTDLVRALRRPAGGGRGHGRARLASAGRARKSPVMPTPAIRPIDPLGRFLDEEVTNQISFLCQCLRFKIIRFLSFIFPSMFHHDNVVR